MRFSKKVVVILLPGLLFGIGARAWSAGPDQAAPVNAEVAPANTKSPSLLSILKPVAGNTDPAAALHQAKCGPSQMYTPHDVVGDSESCIQGRYGAGIGPAFVPVTAP
jgi:hypothetical protein